MSDGQTNSIPTRTTSSTHQQIQNALNHYVMRRMELQMCIEVEDKSENLSNQVSHPSKNLNPDNFWLSGIPTEIIEIVGSYDTDHAGGCG